MSKENGISDSLQRTIDICNKLSAQANPIIETRDTLSKLVESSRIDIPHYENPLADIQLNSLNESLTVAQTITEASLIPREVARFNESLRSITDNIVFKTLGELAISSIVPNYSFTTPLLREISSGMSSVVQAFNSNALKVIAVSTGEFMDSIGSSFMKAMNSPAIEWLQGLDLSPIFTVCEGFDLGDDLRERCRRFNKAYLTAMFECKWFPYAAWAADPSLVEKVAEVLESSRGASKRREQRIDKLICSYYTPKVIRAIKQNWRSTQIEPHIKRILGQALEAHLRGEYALCISSLATMWEGLIFIKAHNVSMQERKRQKMELTKQELAELTEANNYDEIFSDYFAQFIVSSCNKVDDVVDGVPNRHGVSHSWYSSYPNKKASLNAILLTDFILQLEPLSEEHVNTVAE